MTNTERFRRRRARLLRALAEHPAALAAGGAPAAVLFAHPLYPKNGDVEHAYRADSDLAYLTGIEEPACALVLVPGREEGEAVLFLRPRDQEREVWEGKRLGPEAAPGALGVDEAHPIGELDKLLPSLLFGRTSLFAHFGRFESNDQRLFTATAAARARARREGTWPRAFVDLSLVLAPMRQLKDDDEIALLERAAQLSARAHKRAMAVARPGLTEADLEAVLSYEMRRGGAARHGYEPIVAAGENACVLHYVDNRAELLAGELVLIDAGAEVGLYTADITRTFPIGGRFSAPQRRLYDIVLAANERAIAEAKPGTTLRALDEVARRVLAAGLVELGLLFGDVDILVEKRPYEGMPEGSPGRAPLDRFYMHGTGHWLGSDVHDVGPYHDGKTPTALEPGMVFTIEPGLYIPRAADDVPAEYRGIGIRIEDDVLVTADGHRVLTLDAPKHVDDVEALVGSARL